MDILFEKYNLSDETIEKLKICESLCNKNTDNAVDTAWIKLFPFEDNNKDEIVDDNEDETSQVIVDNNTNNNDNNNCNEQSIEVETEPFFFTQNVMMHQSPPVNSNNKNIENEQDQPKLTDTISRIVESLEHRNGILDHSHVINLGDADVTIVIDNLSKELSMTGIDNLCKSICDMDDVQATYWIKIICSNLLLQKIINLEKTSKDTRIYYTVVGRIFTKYPDDIHNLIVTPMLNFDLKNTSVIEFITKSYSRQQKINLISEFSVNIKELKVWHINFLSPLLTDTKIEDQNKDYLLGLLVNKASEFANDKNYSKFVLKFIKFNSPYTEDQKSSLQEIVAFNDTIFSSSIKNIVENLYFHRDLWHIN